MRPFLTPAEGMKKMHFESTTQSSPILLYHGQIGVEDKYNPVRETVEETISLLRDIGHQLLIPSILNLDRTGIHMGKVVTKGFGADYHLLIYITSLSKY